jgi:hypothetical protein
MHVLVAMGMCSSSTLFGRRRKALMRKTEKRRKEIELEAKSVDLEGKAGADAKVSEDLACKVVVDLEDLACIHRQHRTPASLATPRQQGW